VADGVSTNAAADVLTAYTFLSSLTCGSGIGTTLGNGQTLTPNIYCQGAATTLDGNLILDAQGNPDALFIFQIGGAFATTTTSHVILTNSASLCNVYWQINGEFDIHGTSVFRGTVIANGAIHLTETSSLLGRGLSVAGAISLADNIVSIGLPCIASTIIANGPTTFCSGGSVVLSGNIGGTWSTGVTTPSITVTTSGDYFVTNSTLCGSLNSNHIIVTVNPLPTASVISAGGPTTLCNNDSVILSGNNGGIWNNGATTSSITVKTSGDYFVINSNSCGNVTSNHIPVSVILNCATIPTLSEWGMIIFVLLLLGSGTFFIMKRKRVSL
jgi:hypothetical protein